MKTNPYPKDVIIKKYDRLEPVEIDDIKGNSGVYESENYLIGFTLGEPLPTFKIIEDENLNKTKQLLNNFHIANVNSVFGIRSEHKNKVVVDERVEFCDGIISTSGSPIMLPVADCCAIVFVHAQTNVIGICHAGRAEVGYEIGTVFSKKFKECVMEHSGDIQSTKIFLAPHIFPLEHPHQTNKFMFSEDGNFNWWGNHQEFIPKIDEIWYPNIAKATIFQIQNILGNTIPITVSGLSTLQGNGYSYFKRKDNMLNAVFVGLKS